MDYFVINVHSSKKRWEISQYVVGSQNFFILSETSRSLTE